MSFLQVPQAQPPVAPETIFEIAGYPVTNALLLGLLGTFLLILFVIILRKKLALVPKRLQSASEIMVEAFLNLMEQVTGSKKSALKILPIVGTIFVYFGLSNLIGLVPGISSFHVDGTPLFRTPTNDFNLTFSVAFAVVILAQIASIKQFGLLTHIGKYIQITGVINGFKKGIGAGVLSIVDFLIGLLDIVSEFAKVVSLSLRLFGNMYAGEVLAAILLGAFAFLVPIPWLAMNILVGILQAMVFGSLTVAYYSLAVQVQEAEA